MNTKVIAYVSSRNNYSMLEGAVLKNINFDGFEFINVDDQSCDEEKHKGKTICKEHNILFLDNKLRGVQFATQTLVDFINTNRPQCKWIICFQHDNYPLSKSFFLRIHNLIDRSLLNEFGSLGFNMLDMGRYTDNSYQLWQQGEKPLGMLGLCHLNEKYNDNRWLCPNRNNMANKSPEKWRQPFIIEIPFWSTVGINIAKWNKYIVPTQDYQFHLWCPDILMQFNKNNCASLVLPELYSMNNQQMKRKFDIPVNSAHAARKGDHYHFGQYGPHLKNFKQRWGWDYENVGKYKKKIRKRYKGTLIHEFAVHNLDNGPLRSYDFGEY